MMYRIYPKLIVASCLLCVTNQGIAQEKSVATEYFQGDTLAFDYKDNFTNATLSVSGPDGFHTSIYQKNGAPTINLNAQDSVLADGLYHYQITAASDKMVNVDTSFNNGRDNDTAKSMMNVGTSQSGNFRIQNGIIVTESNISEGE